MTLEELFKKRQAHFTKQLMKYGKLVFNDHFMLILVVFIGALGYTYSTWLETIDRSAMYLVFIALTMGYLTLFLGETATYLEEADELFLLPKEQDYITIYQQQTIKSYCIHLVPMIIAVFLIRPILSTVANFNSSDMVALLLMWASMKAIDVSVSYYIDVSGEQQLKRYRLSWRVIMYLATLLSVYFMLMIATVSIVIVAVVVYNCLIQSPTVSQLQLDVLIEREKERKQRIYYFFHLFTDVPYIEQTPHRLRRLDSVIEWLQPREVSSFGYYLRREFVRQRTYSGLVVRLLMVGVLAIIFIDESVMIYMLSVLSHYFILIQLLPLRETLLKHPQFAFHPPTATHIRQDLQVFFRQLSIIVSILFGLAGLAQSFTAASILFGLNLLFMGGFIYLYLPYYFSK